MNILGLDYGTKNIGLAWVDTSIGAVLPYGIMKNKGQKVSNKELADLVKAEKIDKMVIGLPLGLGGQENYNTMRVREFANGIKELVGIPIEFINEIFSSAQADRMGEGVSRDEKSAMIILEDYLNQIR
jgi:putative Holliday junction resolvase